MATISSDKITRAVTAVLTDMMGPKRGALAPEVSATWKQIRDASALIQPTVWAVYQKLVAKQIKVDIDSHEEPAMACLKGQPLKPYKVLGEGVHGTVWLTKRTDGKKGQTEMVVKVGNVELDNHPTVTRHFDRARREFAISKAAGELGVSPKVFDSFFCCANDDSCYYVIVMEYVPGVNLKTWKSQASPEDIDNMRLKMLQKTAILREAGIEHYDLHEGNVIVTPYDEPVVIDFSLAQWINISDFDDDEDSVQRIFSKTQTIDQIVKYVAKHLIHKQIIQFS
jgi:predicted Ser/Thr protein kinase